MTPLFKKLQLPSSLDEILVLNEPKDFCNALESSHKVSIKESLIQVSEIDFALIFVTETTQIENRIETVYPKLIGDSILWFAYPKKTSKNYTTVITKDHGWGVLGDYNLRIIDEVSLNEDWDAVRFRKIKFMNEKQKLHDKTI